MRKKYNTKKSKKFKKVAVEMERGRPKLEIPRSESLHIRLTKFELEKISRIAEKKNISRTEAILQGIDLLIHYKPKRYRTIQNPQKNSEGVIIGETIMFDKK